MSLLSQLRDRNLHHRIPFMRIGSAADRQTRRHACNVVGTMSLVNRPLTFEGLIDSVSLGGMQFRPATSYILDRRGEMVCVEIGPRPFFGTIVATRQSGYGVALSSWMSEAELADIVEQYGLSDENGVMAQDGK